MLPRFPFRIAGFGKSQVFLGLGFLLLGAFGPQVARAQSGSIRGQVVDAVTQESLPGVNVVIAGTIQGSATDLDGRFVIEGLVPGTYAVQASFIGFRTETKSDLVVQASRPTFILFEMRQTAVELEGLFVETSAFARPADAPTSVTTLAAEEVRRTPGGQNDISRSLLSLPGVTGGVDNRNDLLVRGGGPGENSYFLDGIEIPQINHFATQGATGGALGLVNVDFIREAEFYRGGFPVRYGDALSSVLLINNRPGSPDGIAGDFTLGAAEAGLTLDGPLGAPGNWLLSVRRSYLQFLFEALGLPIRPGYWDFQGRLEYDLNRQNRVTVIGIGAIDDFGIVQPGPEASVENQDIFESVLDNDQRTYTAGISWRRLVDSGVITTSLSRSLSDYRFADRSRDDEPLLSNQSVESDTRIRMDGDFRIDPRLTLGLGAGTTLTQLETDFFERATPASTSGVDLQFEDALSAWKSFAYAQLTAETLRGRLSTTAGLRVDHHSFLEAGWYASPRLSANLQVLPEWSVSASVGVFRQSPEMLSLIVRDRDSNRVNRGLPFIQANQAIVGVSWLTRPSLRITLEGFYKHYADYPVLVGNPTLSLANLGGDFGYVGAEPLDGSGTGRAYGLELFAQRKLVERFYFLSAYTLAQSQFSGTDQVLKPSSWDVRHSLSLTGGYLIGKKWQIGLKWRYLSGRPYTPFDPSRSAEEYALTGRGAPDYGRVNSLRTPAYMRLDLRVDRRFSLVRWNAEVYIDIQNVTNRQNLFGYRFTVDPEFPDNLRPIENVGLLPIFGFSVEW
ncbi:MAG: hypothetical protein ACI9W4_002487 [Rhodothermales bacterium]|jgi:hypothetical protein